MKHHEARSCRVQLPSLSSACLDLRWRTRGWNCLMSGPFRLNHLSRVQRCSYLYLTLFIDKYKVWNKIVKWLDWGSRRCFDIASPLHIISLREETSDSTVEGRALRDEGGAWDWRTDRLFVHQQTTKLLRLPGSNTETFPLIEVECKDTKTKCMCVCVYVCVCVCVGAGDVDAWFNTHSNPPALRLRSRTQQETHSGTYKPSPSLKTMRPEYWISMQSFQQWS